MAGAHIASGSYGTNSSWGFVVWKQKAGQAIMPRKVLGLANSLFENSTMQQALIQFQQEIKKEGTGQLTDG